MNEINPIRPIPDFPSFVDRLLSRGYSRNLCRDSCHDHGDPGHVHLRTPDGDDMIAWADGRTSNFDLTQPARLIYPALVQRRGRWAPTGSA